jgi:predicted metal-dependent peptidase
MKRESRTPGVKLDQWLDAFLREPVFLARYPFYAAILAKLTPVADPSIERMAVSLVEGRFYLHIHVDSFVREPQYIRGVLLHEVHHIALGHLSELKFADPVDAELMDLALEMSANEFIEEPLPNPIVWRAFEGIGLRAGQSTLERYAKLQAAKNAGDKVASTLRNLTREQGAKPKPVDDHRH